MVVVAVFGYHALDINCSVLVNVMGAQLVAPVLNRYPTL
jgi:hypothetical protein